MNIEIRGVARAIVFHPKSKKILLVKNYGQNFWHPPGGGWHVDQENIKSCARREVLEETGLKIKKLKLIYCQEFHSEPRVVFLETFWFTEYKGKTFLDHSRLDIDGKVEKVGWFSKQEIKKITVYPTVLRKKFWKNTRAISQGHDTFLGVVKRVTNKT